MEASFLPTSRILQPFDSFPPNLTWLLEIAFWRNWRTGGLEDWRTEASTSCQGLSINYVSNFILGCLWFKVKFFDEIVIYGQPLAGSGCLSPLEGYFQQPCQVWWKRIKRLKSSGSGKKRGLHFDLPVPVAKDLIRKPINNYFKISLVPNRRFLIYSFHRNLEKIPPGQMAGVRTFFF